MKYRTKSKIVSNGCWTEIKLLNLHIITAIGYNIYNRIGLNEKKSLGKQVKVFQRISGI